MAGSSQTAEWKIYILLILCTFFWSGNFVLSRYIHDEIHPVQLAFIRWGIILAFFSPYMILHRKPIIEAFQKHFFLLSLQGILSVFLFNLLLFFGMTDTTATNGLLINSVTPLMIIFIAFALYGERLSLLQVAGILLSMLGVAFLVLKADLENLYALTFNPGDIYIILGAAAWALYSVLLRQKPKFLNAIEFFSTTVISGFIALGLLYFFFDFHTDATHLIHNGKVVMTILLMVIFPSTLSFLFWTKSVESIGAGKAGQFVHLMPLFGSFLAYIVLGETLEFYHAAGAVLIGAGIYISLFYRRPAHKTKRL